MERGEFSSFGRGLGQWMNCGKREVAKDKAQIAAEMPTEAFDDGISHPATWAFIVAILDQRHWSVEIAANMVLFRHGNLQLSHGLLLFHHLQGV
jgi:hypothetical protein